jgi:hypothetical protein
MSRREVIRREEDSAAILTDANLERHFTESEHVVKTIKVIQEPPAGTPERYSGNNH